MATNASWRIAAAFLIAAPLVGIGATRASAQDDAGATITSGAATGDIGDGAVLAPGVTISSGEVSNVTGIGVVISGGTSAGVTPGGGTNVTVAE